MGFEKGHSFGKGRIKGSKNASTKVIKETFQQLLEQNLDKIQDDLNELEPKDRLNFILSLAGYVIPKMKATEITADITTQKEGLSIQEIFAMSDDEIDNLINE
jgi:chaperonin cofactor prefoldin